MITVAWPSQPLLIHARYDTDEHNYKMLLSVEDEPSMVLIFAQVIFAKFKLLCPLKYVTPSLHYIRLARVNSKKVSLFLSFISVFVPTVKTKCKTL